VSDIVHELKALTEKLHAGCDPEVVSRLRLLRRNAADVWIDMGEETLSDLFAGEFGQAHLALLGSGLTGLPMEPEERAFVKPLLKAIGQSWPSSASVGCLLAGMLYLGPHRMPLRHDFFEVPEWFLDAYLNFLLTPPVLFTEPGESDIYLSYLQGLLDYMQELVTGPRALELGNLPEIFFTRLNVVQGYFNDANLTGLLRARSDIAEFALYGQGQQLDSVFPVQSEGRRKRRIKVGFLISAMLDHTESFFALAHMQGLPRESMQISLYSLHKTGHPVEEFARGLVDQIVSLDGMQLSEQVELIRSDDLDILLFLTNVSAVSNPVFYLAMHRLARVQGANMASPVTTGIRNMDFFLSATANEPGENPGEDYRERLIRVPGALNLFSYQCHSCQATINVSREIIGLSGDSVVLFSGANFFKIIPELSRAWVEILSRVPDSVLMLMPFNPNWNNSYPQSIFTARLLREFSAAGIDAHRLLVINPVPSRADVLEVIRMADLYLDSFPFAGSCSIFDPMSIACPSVVRCGNRARSSHGAAVLGMFGLQDMVTHSEEEYIDLAVNLASDASSRNRVRERILQRLQAGNPMLEVKSLGNSVGTAMIELVQGFHDEESRLLSMDAAALAGMIDTLVAGITVHNPFAAGLTDSALIRMLILPCFRNSGAAASGRLHMVDVGACYGEIVRPFLEEGWSADLFEPDPECMSRVRRNLRSFRHSVRFHAKAVGPEKRENVTFFKAECDGLSGLSESPYGKTGQRISVPSVRLDGYLSKLGVDRVDMLKIDTEGWDIEVLMTHDFENLPPRLVFIEVNTAFEMQSMARIREAIIWMQERGYTALTFGFQDDGNFRKGIWNARLSALTQGEEPGIDGDSLMANILFYRREDLVFMTMLIIFLRSLLPGTRAGYGS